MNQRIIDQYGLKFENKIMDFGSQGKEIRKVFKSNVASLEEFMMWSPIESFEDRILPAIEEVLSEVTEEIETSNDVILIFININNVEFVSDVSDTIFIPTEDFKEIVLAWIDFWHQEPLDKSKVLG